MRSIRGYCSTPWDERNAGKPAFRSDAAQSEIQEITNGIRFSF